MSILALFLTLHAAPDFPALQTEASKFGASHGYEVRWEYQVNAAVREWNVVGKPVTATMSAKAQKFWAVFKQEFGKYPKCFLERVKIKEVDFVSGLSVYGQQRYAMPDYVNERLVLDVDNIANDETYVRHVIHHEFYHMVEEQLNGSAYFKDPKWARLNPSGFKYGLGGDKMRDPNVTPLRHQQKGFVNLYSTSGLEEDKAEMWAVMFCSTEWKKVSPWLKEDAVLAAKVDYLTSFCSKLCPEMNKAFWIKARAK